MSSPTLPSTNDEQEAAGLRREALPSTTSEESPFSAAASNTATVNPYTPSDWERSFYYNGISGDPPELLYRSDLLQNPYPIPKGRFAHVNTKTICGVFNTPLNAVWRTVAPQILALLRAHKIHYSSLSTVRFITQDEDGVDTRGPVVIWIATHPETTTAENAHDVSMGILAVLKAHEIEGVVVEWIEGAVERL